MSSKHVGELAELTKALGHPARLQILQLLIERNTCICGEIVDELPLAQSTVSQHLKVLKEANLIRGEIDGPSICYCINPETISRLKQLIAAL
jgi:ArsR family transcriptional regulator